MVTVKDLVIRIVAGLVELAFGEAQFEGGEGFGGGGPLPRCGGVIGLHKRFML